MNHIGPVEMLVFRTILLLGLAALTARAAVPPAASNQLRSIIKLPVELQINMFFDPATGFSVLAGRMDHAKEIASARKELQGDWRDAENHFRIGTLHREAADLANARKSFAQAADLYRQRVEVQNPSGALLAEYGAALRAAERDGEAERVLREALELSPNAWKAWIELGQLLQAGAVAEVLSSLPRASRTRSLDTAIQTVRRRKPSPAQVESAEKKMNEAAECFDKAMTEAPEESDVLRARAFHLAGKNFYDTVLDALRLDEPAPNKVLLMTYSPAGRPAFQAWARHDPDNPLAIATAALHTFLSASAESGRWTSATIADHANWQILDEHTQRFLRESVGRLEQLSMNPKSSVAANAFEKLGALKLFVLRDLPGAEAGFRQAVALEPERDQAWDFLLAVLEQRGRFEEMAETSERRLDARNSIRNRLLAARAADRLNQSARAVNHTQAALKLDNNQFTPHLMMATLLMKRPDEGALWQARSSLARAQELLGSRPQRSQLIDLNLNYAIWLALNDHVDEARSLLRMVLDLDQQNQYARQILAVLS